MHSNYYTGRIRRPSGASSYSPSLPLKCWQSLKNTGHQSHHVKFVLTEEFTYSLILFRNLFLVLGIMKMSSSLTISAAYAIGLTLAIAFILLASNFTMIIAQQQQQQQQQQLTSQPGEIENRTTAALRTPTTTFQSTNDSFSVQVPEGWIIHDVNNTGSMLSEESTQGYGILAQLCPEEKLGAGTY